MKLPNPSIYPKKKTPDIQATDLKAKYNGIKKKVIAIIVVLTFNLISPTIAISQEKIIPPADWWLLPSWSPDGKSIAVSAPRPELAPVEGPGGRTLYVEKRNSPKQKTMILRAKDYSLIRAIDQKQLACWSLDGRLIAGQTFEVDKLGNLSGTLNIYSAVTGNLVQKLTTADITGFSWSPSNKYLLVTQKVKPSIIDLNTNVQKNLTFQPRESDWSNSCWSPDGSLAAAKFAYRDALTSSNAIRLWRIGKSNTFSDIALSSSDANFDWSPDGTKFVYSQPTLLQVLNAETKVKLLKVTTIDTKAAKFNWSPDRKSFAYSDCDYIYILDSNTLKKRFRIQSSRNGKFSFSWSPDSKFIFIFAGKTIAVCDASDGKYLASKTWHDMEQAQLVPDCKAILIHNLTKPPVVETLSLPPSPTTNIFKNGHKGMPDWGNFSSPKDLNECFATLNKELSPADRSQFMSSRENQVVETYGVDAVKNNTLSSKYSTWGKIELTKFFRKLGVDDEKKFIGIMLTSYWRHLNKKSIDLDQQIIKHKDELDNGKALIKIDRLLPENILSCKLEDQSKSYSIGSIQSRIKLVAFLDTYGMASAAQLKCLQDIRSKYSEKDLAIIVLIVEEANLTDQAWPTVKIQLLPFRKSFAQYISAFRQNPGNIKTSVAPLNLCTEFIKFGKAARTTRYGPPQTLVITANGMVKARLNGFDYDETNKLLVEQIQEALRH